MNQHSRKPPVRRLNRRGFLYGLGGVSIGLPFLESAPERSAWAEGESPVFALFIGTANGIMVGDFWPAATGTLNDLASESAATAILGDFADRLLMIRGLRYPASLTSRPHAQSYPQLFTGAPFSTTARAGEMSCSTAPSIDVILAPLLNPDATEPLTLYSGMRASYVTEGLSWSADGYPRSAEGNPFVVYSALIQAASPDADPLAVLPAALVRRQSAIDLARDELMSFRGRANISQQDTLRVDQHLTALRDIENSMSALGPSLCSTQLLDTTGIAAVNDTFQQNGMVEVVSKLQLELVAFAFACNLNRVATLQSGDALDYTLYDVPSNARGWTFNQISHGSSGPGSGNDATAALAHAEIDRLRTETLAHGLRQLDAHGLLDKSVVLWANPLSGSDSGTDLPFILAGNPYGRLRSGQYIKQVGSYNGELLTTVANVLGVDQSIGTATDGLDELLA